MMLFRTIRDAIKNYIAEQSRGDFTVVGAQRRGKGARTVLNLDRLVEIYYARGEFPKGGGAGHNTNQHNMTFRIDLTVSRAVEGDVATIEDPNSTAEEMAVAIAQMKESGVLADESLDELFDCVYQILMDATALDFGLEIGVVASRWVSQLSKDEPVKIGNYTILTGSMILTCGTAEPVYGYKGVEADPEMGAEVDLETDETGKAGVLVS